MTFFVPVRLFTGVDMSSAFDTIDRQTILNVLSDAGSTEDEARLARLPLTNQCQR